MTRWFASVAVCRDPCINGARCVDVDVCQCRHGYTGNNCEAGLLITYSHIPRWLSACKPPTRLTQKDPQRVVRTRGDAKVKIQSWEINKNLFCSVKKWKNPRSGFGTRSSPESNRLFLVPRPNSPFQIQKKIRERTESANFWVWVLRMM